jgi:hypothetical protein
MSKKFYKAIIEDMENQNCTETEIANLLDIFEYTMKNTACTLARSAWFELADFGTSKQRNISQFNLTMKKQITNGHEQWVGIFTDTNKELKILGSLQHD